MSVKSYNGFSAGVSTWLASALIREGASLQVSNGEEDVCGLKILPP